VNLLDRYPYANGVLTISSSSKYFLWLHASFFVRSL